MKGETKYKTIKLPMDYKKMLELKNKGWIIWEKWSYSSFVTYVTLIK